MSSCRAWVQPWGLKPKAEASTTSTSLDRCPDSRADRCPVSPWATNTNASEEQKTKPTQLNLRNLFTFPRVHSCFLWKQGFSSAVRLAIPVIDHSTWISLQDQKELCNSVREDHYFIAVFIFSLKQSLFGTFHSKLYCFTNCLQQFADNLCTWRICCTESHNTKRQQGRVWVYSFSTGCKAPWNTGMYFSDVRLWWSVLIYFTCLPFFP